MIEFRQRLMTCTQNCGKRRQSTYGRKQRATILLPKCAGWFSFFRPFGDHFCAEAGSLNGI